MSQLAMHMDEIVFDLDQIYTNAAWKTPSGKDNFSMNIYNEKALSMETDGSYMLGLSWSVSTVDIRTEILL